jgi:hypothetical protein
MNLPLDNEYILIKILLKKTPSFNFGYINYGKDHIKPNTY